MFMRLILLLLIANVAFASDPYPKNENITVSNYIFRLRLNDSTDVITGEAWVTIKFKKPVASFDLNLIGKKNGDKGMDVLSVRSSGKPVDFTFSNDLISIEPPQGVEEATFVIDYKGIPADGLIISKNKFGDRTFFGDNWPDRGRHWLPTIDHPSYKATVEFIVIAPSHYKVVATGQLIDEVNLDHKLRQTRYREPVPVSVKVMTIGVARFSVQQSGLVGKAPVTTWVYPQNEDDGFSDFSIAPKVLEYLEEYIGPYPFEKLAHVQSKTKFGGLENASNIFYFENSVNGKNERESLIAHETAHQWFGNSATERDWHHVWLSEGITSYMTALYMENAHGRDELVRMMTESRRQVIDFSKKNSAPIVDTTIVDINRVLSTNTYQKASWIMHMLRRKIGDENFHKGIREYYDTYKMKTALTGDFAGVMQKYSNEDLTPFFKRWMFTGGQPTLAGSWRYDRKQKTVFLDVEMTGNGGYDLPLEISVDSKVETLLIRPGMNNLRIHSNSKPAKVEVDPGVWLLANLQISSK